MSLGRRILVWLLSLAGGQALSFILPRAYGRDPGVVVDVVLGLAIGVGLIVLFDRIAAQQHEAFSAVARGDRAAIAEILARRKHGGEWMLPDMDPFGTAALEVVAGDRDAARALLSQGPELGTLPARLRACIEAHLDIMTADPVRLRAALERLLALPRFTIVEARERYRALLIATAASLLSPHDREAAARAIEVLASAGDREARAFTCWVRSAVDAPLDPGEAAEEARSAARIAGAHGLEPLARAIESRAAAIERAAARIGPYRR